MIRDSGIYKIKILKEDVMNWNDDEYVFFVKTDDIESAKEIQTLKSQLEELTNYAEQLRHSHFIISSEIRRILGVKDVPS